MFKFANHITRPIQNFFKDSLIEHVKSRYAVEFSSKSLHRLKLIDQKGYEQRSKFKACLKLLENAHLLGNLEKHKEKKAKDYLYTLKWAIKVSKRDTPETVANVLAQLEKYKLLNQKSLNRLKKRKNETEFLSSLEKVLLFFDKKHSKGRRSSDLRPLVKYCLLLDRKALSMLYDAISDAESDNLNEILYKQFIARVESVLLENDRWLQCTLPAFFSLKVTAKKNETIPLTLQEIVNQAAGNNLIMKGTTQQKEKIYFALNDLIKWKKETNLLTKSLQYNTMSLNEYVEYARGLDKISANLKSARQAIEECNTFDERKVEDETYIPPLRSPR